MALQQNMGWTAGSQFSSEHEIFLFSTQIVSGVNSLLYTLGSGTSPWDKASGRKPNVKNKDVGTVTQIPEIISITWCLITSMQGQLSFSYGYSGSWERILCS